MVWGLFGSKSSPALVEEVAAPVDFRTPMRPTSPENAVTASWSLKDIAEGKVPRRWCLDCGEEFAACAYKGKQRYACRACWRRNKNEGRPPVNPAPHGPEAGGGIWDVKKQDGPVRRKSVMEGMMKHQSSMNSQEGMMKHESSMNSQEGKARRHSVAQGELAGRSSVASVASANLDQAGVKARNSERRGSKSSTLGVPAEGQLSWLQPNPRAMDFKALEKLDAGRNSVRADTVPKDFGASPSNGSRQATKQSSERRNSKVLQHEADILRAQRDDLRARETEAAEESGQQEAASRGPASKESASLPQVTTPTRRGSVAMLPVGRESDMRQRSKSVSYAVEDVRAYSVMKKLSQNKMVMEAMCSLVAHLARSKLTHQELFDILDTNGDGELSRAEMQIGLRKLGVNLPPIELDAVLRGFDADGNGAIDAEEFTETLTAWMPLVEPRLKAEEAAAREAQGLQAEQVLLSGGLEAGMRVTSMARLAGQQDKEEGIVLGPGISKGTVRVKFERSGAELNVKPSLLRRVKASQ